MWALSNQFVVPKALKLKSNPIVIGQWSHWLLKKLVLAKYISWFSVVQKLLVDRCSVCCVKHHFPLHKNRKIWKLYSWSIPIAPIFRWLPQLHIHLNQHLLQCTLGSGQNGGQPPKEVTQSNPTLWKMTINSWYKPFPNGWFIHVWPTLMMMNDDKPKRWTLGKRIYDWIPWPGHHSAPAFRWKLSRRCNRLRSRSPWTRQRPCPGCSPLLGGWAGTKTCNRMASYPLLN